MGFFNGDRVIRVLIIGETYSRAQAMLAELVGFRTHLINSERKSKEYSEITMVNGTHYEARKFSMGLRGIKCDLVYYDTKLDKDVFEETFCSVTICSAFREIDNEFATYVEFDPDDFQLNKWKNNHGLFIDMVENLKSK